MRTRTVSFAPDPDKSKILSPSLKPPSTKSIPPVFISIVLLVVIVSCAVRETPSAAVETVIFIFDAFAAVLSDTCPTFISFPGI